MNRIRATVKIPLERMEEILDQLQNLGVKTIEAEIVPYEQFVLVSSMNYDCVFSQMWDEKKEVVYLHFFFEDSSDGRSASFQLEYNFMQIPLNLRYE